MSEEMLTENRGRGRIESAIVLKSMGSEREERDEE